MRRFREQVETLPVHSLFLRRALTFFLSVVVLATLCCGLVYAGVQQDLRSGANDPQIQLAEDAARALEAGARPASLVGATSVDVAPGLAPFLIIYHTGGWTDRPRSRPWWLARRWWSRSHAVG